MWKKWGKAEMEKICGGKRILSNRGDLTYNKDVFN